MYENLLELLDATPGEACLRAAAVIRALIEDRRAAWSESNDLRRERNLLVDWAIRQLNDGWHIDCLITGREPFATREEATKALLDHMDSRSKLRRSVIEPGAPPIDDRTRRRQALDALVDQAQELDMGYGPRPD